MKIDYLVSCEFCASGYHLQHKRLQNFLPLNKLPKLSNKSIFYKVKPNTPRLRKKCLCLLDFVFMGLELVKLLCMHRFSYSTLPKGLITTLLTIY